MEGSPQDEQAAFTATNEVGTEQSKQWFSLIDVLWPQETRTAAAFVPFRDEGLGITGTALQHAVPQPEGDDVEIDAFYTEDAPDEPFRYVLTRGNDRVWIEGPDVRYQYKDGDDWKDVTTIPDDLITRFNPLTITEGA